MRAFVVIAALLLPGCTAQFTRSAAADCEAEGFAKDSPGFAACVQRGYEERRQRAVGIARALGNMQPPPNPYAPPPPAGRFLRNNYVSGFNRICIYDTISGQEVITIPSAQLCPIS